jgi:glycosyltransferase involved in cell wall biosynthesis
MKSEFKFTLLMTISPNENPSFLDEAIKSISINQSVKPNQTILIVDGPSPLGIKNILQKFQSIINDLEIIELDQNYGQAYASNVGLEKCKYDFIARMDSDDISLKDRFNKQINFLKKNSNIDCLGGLINEFEIKSKRISYSRKVPERNFEIYKFLRFRNPINNVTSMIKKDLILKVGGYNGTKFVEDYNLFVRLAASGARFHNLQEPLVLVRLGKSFFQKRSKIALFPDWYKTQKILLKSKLTNYFYFLLANITMLVFLLLPIFMKKFFYKYFLRK